MDITLERVLSLIPRKPDGKFVHGAKKAFAISIGYDSGDVVSMWINGSSTSYRNKLHEISAKYNVSVEWLRGETDQKEKPSTLMSEELDLGEEAITRLLDKMSFEDLAELQIKIAQLMKDRR